MQKGKIHRRDFLKVAGSGLGLALVGRTRTYGASPGGRSARPNLLYIFADQWRAQATGYAGNPDVQTPNIDRLEKQSINFENAVSTCSVCSPYRASLLTGQYPLTHGVFLNDLHLNDAAQSLAEVYRDAGYKTAYIGKWHLDGNGRDAYIPPESRQGFDYWKVLECSHTYFNSEYYAGNNPEKKVWPGYDADAQTDDAINYMTRCAEEDSPFVLFLSWGPPHAPYRQVPENYLKEYDSKQLTVRPNVPKNRVSAARNTLTGYYAHCTALDDCMGRLLEALAGAGLDKNTIVVFTSDHGDMLYSQGETKKQKPYDESIRVPFLLRCPSAWNVPPQRLQTPLGSPDIMPTLLALSGAAIPSTVEGEDLSGLIVGRAPDGDRAVLITCPVPFGQWKRRLGGREYRGVRTRRYTYARSLKGDWLLYDNQTDPYQQKNLIHDPEYAGIRKTLAAQLDELLQKTGDEFLPAADLIKKCRYRVNPDETIPHNDPAYEGQVSVSART